MDAPMKRIVPIVLRVALGVLFAWAGAVKIADPQQFTLDVHYFQLTPWDASVLIAIYLPWLELFAGLALLARRLYAGAIFICGALSVVFLGAIVSAWSRDLDITCGCFGRTENATNYPLHIALNAAMLAVCAVLARILRKSAESSAAVD